MLIALTHGGMVKDKEGRYTRGEDVELAKEVPGIDVVISCTTSTSARAIIIMLIPVVQAEDGDDLANSAVTACDQPTARLPANPAEDHDFFPATRPIAAEIEKLKKDVTKTVFASRGFSVDQPLAIAPQDLPTPSATSPPARSGQPLHRRLPGSHEGGYRLLRQRLDARRPTRGKSACRPFMMSSLWRLWAPGSLMTPPAAPW